MLTLYNVHAIILLEFYYLMNLLDCLPAQHPIWGNDRPYYLLYYPWLVCP